MRVSKQNLVTESTPGNGARIDYRDELRTIEAKLTDSRRRQSRSLFVLGGLLIFLVVFLWAIFVDHKLSPASLAVPIAAIALVFRRYEMRKGTALRLAHRANFYRRGVERISGTWRGKGHTGEEFTRADHPYQWDIDILGEGSLFELLCTTRSEAGGERLASFLLDVADLEEAVSRQAAVKELRDATALREQLAQLGTYGFQDCDRKIIGEWLNAPLLKFHPVVPVFLFICSSICALLAMLGLSTLVSWASIASYLVPLVTVQVGIAITFSQWVRSLLKILEPLANEFTVLKDGLELMGRQHFNSEKLTSLLRTVRAGNAASHVRTLERLVHGVSRRKTDFAYLPSLCVALGTQLVFALECWRTKHRQSLTLWLDCWAEFEALNALAGYAYEHPQNVFPEFVAAAPVFKAKELGHPLLPGETCVGNDVVLDPESRFAILSGSNMAGKSTFLRAVGMNAVLAYAGAPVCAAQASLAIFSLYASILIADSLHDGKSKFLAEIERLNNAIQATRGTRPVLFLIDEILSGTNSNDRRIAAESIIASLVVGGAVGVLSTHDLALCEIANAPNLRGANLCMESENPADPLDFDYRVKLGRSQNSNALAILKMVGIGCPPRIDSDR